MSLPIVFVHGSEAGGSTAWPTQADADFDREKRFVTRQGYAAGVELGKSDFDADAAAVVEAVGDGGHVVAHSFGALVAIRAAELSPATVASLILFEPMVYSLVRGEPRVEAYISSLDAQGRAESMSASDLTIDPDIFAEVATLAITGNSHPAYDIVVDRIVSLGGEKAAIEGLERSLTDAPESVDVIRDFIERVEARVSG